MAGKLIMMLCLITSEVLKLKGLKNLSEVNYSLQTNLWKKFVKVQKLNFLIHFSSKGRHVTHLANLCHQTWCNDDVRITSLYGWKAHSKDLPPNFWSIVVRRGWKNLVRSYLLTSDQLVKENCQSPKPQFLKGLKNMSEDTFSILPNLWKEN